MLSNRQLRANKSVLVGALLVGVSLFSDPASAQFRPNSRGNGFAIVFADPGFRGASYSLRGDTPDLRPYKLNDKVSSIEIPAGETWEVCASINYTSTCQLLRGSVADLRTIGWDDRISSLRRVDGNFRDGRNQDGDFRDGRPRGGFSRRLDFAACYPTHYSKENHKNQRKRKFIFPIQPVSLESTNFSNCCFDGIQQLACPLSKIFQSPELFSKQLHHPPVRARLLYCCMPPYNSRST